jgi:hypothetical protein
LPRKSRWYVHFVDVPKLDMVEIGEQNAMIQAAKNCHAFATKRHDNSRNYGHAHCIQVHRARLCTCTATQRLGLCPFVEHLGLRSAIVRAMVEA